MSEISKARLHRRLAPASYLLRDRQGFEIDHLLEAGDRWIATEAKPKQTVAGDFFTHLEKVSTVFPSLVEDRSVEARIVYGGDIPQTWARSRSCTGVKSKI